MVSRFRRFRYIARRQGHSVGLAEPVQRYFNAFETGRAHEIEDMCPGHVAITASGRRRCAVIDSFEGLFATIHVP